MVIAERHWYLICLCRACPWEKLLVWQPLHTKRRLRCFHTWLRAVSVFSLIIPQQEQKASCLRLPSMFNDCLTKLPCQWKLINRNSLSVPPGNWGGTTAIRLGTPEPEKVDNTTSRCFVRLSLVYNRTQLGLKVNLSGGHSVRRPSSWRIGNQ